MTRVHSKMAHKEAQKVINNQSLLSENDRQFVEKVREQVNLVQQQARPFVQSLPRLLDEHYKHEQSLINIRFAALNITEERESLVGGYSSVSKFLNGILYFMQDNILHIGGNINTLDDLTAHFNLDASDINSEANRRILIKKLIPIEKADQDRIDVLEAEADQSNKNRWELEEKIATYHAELEKLQNTLGVKFETDSNFELTKISKGKSGPEFSVIFTNTAGSIHPYILYRGKEYEGVKRQLGEGGFGKVKLAQDYLTNELVAVKVQLISHLPETVLQKEKAILQEMDHFKGSVQRSKKDYIVQELHYGSELESLVTEGDLTDTTSVNMLKQAAIELQKMHDGNLIHRDIKLENYIWDNEMSKCVLIDFAFVEKVKDDEIIYLRDEAGSASYLSAEAAQGNYSKRSDIYAFGVLMKEVLEKHPAVYEQLKHDIDKLTKVDVEERATSLADIINKLSSLQVTQHKSLTSRPAAITRQHGLLLNELRAKHQASIDNNIKEDSILTKKHRRD